VASGNDARFGIARETTYDTRVAPARFIPLSSMGITYEFGRTPSAALGLGRWQRVSVVTSMGGAGPLAGEVPTTGFGYLLDGLNSNVNTPVQQAATAAYLTTFTLDTPITKSYSIQVQMPPVTSSTLLPIDYTGVTFGSLTLSWASGGLFTYSIDTAVRSFDTTQSLATYTPPASYVPFSFIGGSVTIGGSVIADLIGDGTLTLSNSLRTDARALGSGGKFAKPVETDKPTATISTTADFNDLSHLNRVTNQTIADVVLKFEGATIASTYKYGLTVTIPDCVFTSPVPAVDGPGPVSQAITMESSSSTGNPVVVSYMSTGTTL
jgi:hypothetical protein